MKRDAAAGSDVWIGRSGFQVKFPAGTHDEDKDLLRTLVQYASEVTAAKTIVMDGVDKARCWTGFDYEIKHVVTDTRDKYSITFHLPYNVIFSPATWDPFRAMGSYYFDESCSATVMNWPHQRMEMLLSIRSRHDRAFQAPLPLPTVAIIHSLPPQPSAPAAEEEPSESWLSRPLKRLRHGLF